MSFGQRHIIPADAESTALLWFTRDPEDEISAVWSEREPSIPDPLPSDQYVTIDERVEGVIAVVAADWPKIDADGLRFHGSISTSSFDQADLQTTVDRLRSAADQFGRPLRIGDSFWVRGYSASSLEAWKELRDITIHARAMAKAAVAVVAVGAIEQEPYLAADKDIVDESDSAGNSVPDNRRDEPPPSGAATANPVV